MSMAELRQLRSYVIAQRIAEFTMLIEFTMLVQTLNYSISFKEKRRRVM